jgi:hypothetical protein
VTEGAPERIDVRQLGGDDHRDDGDGDGHRRSGDRT